MNPAYIKNCVPLLILSAAATVTTSFDRFPDERLNWLQAILDAINPTVRRNTVNPHGIRL